MVALAGEDIRNLIDLLKDVPELATERSRRQMLEYAGLKQFVSVIDVSGSPFVAVGQIISDLAAYGRLTYDHEALGLLLNSMKRFVGKEQQETLNAVLAKYDLMTPIVAPPDIDEWHGQDTPETVQEKVIGENTLRPVAFLTRGLQVSRPVAHIGVRAAGKRWSGTGFMISPHLLLTNHHVIGSQDLLNTALFRFNYQESFDGSAQRTYEYRAKPGGTFYACQALDYTVIELDRAPGSRWHWLPLRSIRVKKDDRVNIIQHPSGQPKQIALQNNFVEYVGDNVVQYVTSTLPGSSGSPVLNDDWQVVALHHAGGNVREPTSRRQYFRNEGILIESILADLPLALRRRLDDAGVPPFETPDQGSEEA